MRPQSAMVTITRAVTVAAGVFAPGHLGELTQYLPFELVDDVLEQTRTVQRRLRELPSRVGVYFVLALGMYPRLGYARVWGKLTAGLEASVARWLRFFVESVPAAARPHRLGWRAICGMFGQPRPTWLQHPCFLLPARSASVAVWWHAKCV